MDAMRTRGEISRHVSTMKQFRLFIWIMYTWYKVENTSSSFCPCGVSYPRHAAFFFFEHVVSTYRLFSQKYKPRVSFMFISNCCLYFRSRSIQGRSSGSPFITHYRERTWGRVPRWAFTDVQTANQRRGR